MEIRIAEEKEYVLIAALFRKFFTVHNVFQREVREIIEYITNEANKHELLIYIEEDQILAATFLVNFGRNLDGSHKLWKFRHFSYLSEEAGLMLLNEAENMIQNESNTSKVELTIAENEMTLGFFKKEGYNEE